ncbi:MAG: 5'/3'-nucleotidase SurE, partial [Candidatus Aminicenantaceae bacterium]
PADCIYLALQKLLSRRPDLILSGINPGPNLGQQDISYSGTVAGAVQGTFLQISSAAISCLPDEEGVCHFDAAARFAEKAARMLLKNGLPQRITLNINVPPPPVKGVKAAKLGEKRYNPEILVKKDPRQRDYYWIGTGQPKAMGDPNSDVRIIEKGHITVTPLHRDFTDYTWLDHSAFHSLLDGIQDETA